MYRYLPYFERLFVTPLHKNGIVYETDSHIKIIPVPVLILHAIDDPTVPHRLGVKVAKKNMWVLCFDTVNL